MNVLKMVLDQVIACNCAALQIVLNLAKRSVGPQHLPAFFDFAGLFNFFFNVLNGILKFANALPSPFMNSGIFLAPKNTRTKRPMRRISWKPTPLKNNNVAFMAYFFIG